MLLDLCLSDTLFIHQHHLQCREHPWSEDERERMRTTVGGGGWMDEMWKALQSSSAICRKAHFSCVVHPRTGWVIRPTHLAPLPPESGRESSRVEETSLQLLIAVMMSQGSTQVVLDELLLFFHFFLPSVSVS